MTLWENANRYCGGAGGDHDCTLVNPTVATRSTCSTTLLATTPYIDDCRWKVQNVTVHDNTLTLTRAKIPNCTTANDCGDNALVSQYGTCGGPCSPGDPYLGTFVEDNITFHQNNHFSNNTYHGPWRFEIHEQNNLVVVLHLENPALQPRHRQHPLVVVVGTSPPSTRRGSWIDSRVTTGSRSAPRSMSRCLPPYGSSPTRPRRTCRTGPPCRSDERPARAYEHRSRSRVSRHVRFTSRPSEHRLGRWRLVAESPRSGREPLDTALPLRRWPPPGAGREAPAGSYQSARTSHRGVASGVVAKSASGLQKARTVPQTCSPTGPAVVSSRVLLASAQGVVPGVGSSEGGPGLCSPRGGHGAVGRASTLTTHAARRNDREEAVTRTQGQVGRR